MAIDITGVWHCNDGGTYYIRQINQNWAFWFAESLSTNPQWYNIATGASIGENWFIMYWKDFPKDNINQPKMLDNGALTIVANENKIITSGTNVGGVFRGSSWWRLFMANSNTKEVHVFDCEWAAKIAKKHRVQYKILEQAIKDGYNGCYYCLPEYDTG